MAKDERDPKDESHPKPPAPPEMVRRPVLTPLQRVGLPLLALVPVLAIVGALGVSLAAVEADGGSLRLGIEYPSRARKGVAVDAVVTVENVGPAPLRGVTVSLGRAYLDSFQNVVLTPSADEVTDDGYRIEIGDLPGGEERSVTVELTPGWEYGRRRGSVTASADGLDRPVGVEFATFNFP